MSYADDLKIFLNIMAQSPEGLSDPQLIGKYSKAKFQMHTMDSMNQIQAQMPAPQVAGGTNSSQAAPSTPQGGLGENPNENQQNPADNGNGAMNVPPQM